MEPGDRVPSADGLFPPGERHLVNSTGPFGKSPPGKPSRVQELTLMAGLSGSCNGERGGGWRLDTSEDGAFELRIGRRPKTGGRLALSFVGDQDERWLRLSHEASDGIVTSLDLNFDDVAWLQYHVDMLYSIAGSRSPE